MNFSGISCYFSGALYMGQNPYTGTRRTREDIPDRSIFLAGEITYKVIKAAIKCLWAEKKAWGFPTCLHREWQVEKIANYWDQVLREGVKFWVSFIRSQNILRDINKRVKVIMIFKGMFISKYSYILYEFESWTRTIINYKTSSSDMMQNRSDGNAIW